MRILRLPFTGAVDERNVFTGTQSGIPFACPMAMKGRANESEPHGRGEVLRVQGVVVPAAWDESGRIVRVAVATHNENELLIIPDEKGREVVQWIREEVELVGRLERTAEGPVLRVTSVRRMDTQSA